MSSPLQPLTSIKVKLGLLVTASALVAALVGALASSAAVPMLLAVPVTVALALAVTQLLAVGMTSPLREMTEATRRMARGDYRGRVRADSSDEIGELARAFNQMAAELASVDASSATSWPPSPTSSGRRWPHSPRPSRTSPTASVRPTRSTSAGPWTRPSGSAPWSVTCSSSPASRPGVAPLRLGPVRVGALVDEVVADLVPTGRAVRFDVDIPEALEVQADPARLRQLLTNVLDNAVRHSPDGGRVRVTCDVTPDRWRLDVADEGPGVAPADRERAFERFGTLADPVEGAATGGTGLGLAIARWVATLHSGAIRFADPPAGTSGALLRVDLPLSPPARPSAPTHQEAPVPTIADPAHAARPPAPPPPIYPGHPGSSIVPAPVLDPLFGRFWPDVPGGSRAVVVAAAGVGALAGLVLPNHSAGLALFLVVVAAGLTVAYAARHKRDPFTLTCLGLAAPVHAARCCCSTHRGSGCSASWPAPRR